MTDNDDLTPEEVAEMERLFKEMEERLKRDGPWPGYEGDAK